MEEEKREDFEDNFQEIKEMQKTQELKKIEMEKEEVKEERKDSEKKGHPVFVTFLIILLLAVFTCMGFFGGVYYYKNSLEKNKNNKSKASNSEEIINVINKINTFIDIATYSDSMGYNLSSDFYSGKKELSFEDKLLMTYIKTVHIDSKTTKETVPEKHIDYELYPGAGVFVLSVDTFEKEYKDLFGEEIDDYTKFAIEACPVPILDKENNKFYLVNHCGGTGAEKFIAETKKIEKNGDNWIVYQKAGYNWELKELIWTFDENGNFISTVRK